MNRRSFLNYSAALATLVVSGYKRADAQAITPKVDVLTREFNNARLGSNSAETILNVNSITQRGLVKAFSCNMPGDARGSEGMTLVKTSVVMEDGATHDVLIQCDMNDSVWAFDANNGKLLWQQSVGTSITNSRSLDMYLINDHWGILSTPVIDPDTNIIYAIAMCSTDSTIKTAAFYLIGLHLVDGSQAFTPVSLEGAAYTPPNGLPTLYFKTVARKQRAGLLMTNVNGVKTIFVGCGSFNEAADTNNGWIIALDITTTTPFVAAAYCTCPRYNGGGIWQGAGALVANKAGNIFCCTGNGSFDGVTDFGECALKLQYTPKSATTTASITVMGWACSFTDTGRIGGNPTLADVSLIKNYASLKLIAKKRCTTAHSQADFLTAQLAPQTTNSAGYYDQDLGSARPTLIEASWSGFATDYLIYCGKDGIGYVIDTNNMPNQKLSDFSAANIQQNVYPKFKWIGFLTYYNPSASPTPTDLTILNQSYGGVTRHQHAGPVAIKCDQYGVVVYNHGENGVLRAWQLTSAGQLTYLAQGNEVASAQAQGGGMPGGMLTASYDATNPTTAVIYDMIPDGNSNQYVSNGRLVCYDALAFVTNADGSKTIKKIWDSSDWNLRFAFNKFNIPTPINGHVYYPNYNGQIDAYTLSP